MAEMAWLAFVLVVSSAPDSTMTDRPLAQRRLLPHCDRLCFLLGQTIPKAPCNEEESSLDIACHIIGDLYEDQGKLREAEDMYVWALAGKEKALGPEHTSTLETVQNLGVLFEGQGKLREAEDMYVRALTGYEKALGPEHTSTLQTVNNLGILYEGQGKLREAEDMYVRALAGYEKALGPEHTWTLGTVNNLGILHQDQGKLREAEDMYVRALAGSEKALGPEHTSTLRTVNNLGTLYRGQGNLRETEDMYMRALAGYEKALGPEHTSILNKVNNLGVLYKNQGKLREAEHMYVRAFAGCEKHLGPEYTSTISEDCNNLKNVLEEISRLPMTPQLDRGLRLKIKGSLKLILGEGTNPIAKRALIIFPSPFLKVARKIFDRFESLHWGAPSGGDVKGEYSIDDGLPPPTHPIFGRNGLMRGIVIGSPGSNANSFRIKEGIKQNAKVYGHNGLNVGAWWPYQICALRDGAHGLLVAGISGSKFSAYSIILSGKYSSLDKDRGQLITYSDSRALENKNTRSADCSLTTLAMKNSFKRGKDIRVLRSSRNKGSPWAVARGIRYDGLYAIIGEKKKTNKVGGVYLSWSLKRNKNKQPVDLTRPTAEDLRLFDQIKEGYGLEE